MPAAVITSGTIIGEIRMDMIRRRCGISERLRPIAATVPSDVDNNVAQMPMKKLLRMARIHWLLFQVSDIHAQSSGASGACMPLRKISLYQRSENASGSKANIPGVKLK